jgi:hypothetical protein
MAARAAPAVAVAGAVAAVPLSRGLGPDPHPTGGRLTSGQLTPLRLTEPGRAGQAGHRPGAAGPADPISLATASRMTRAAGIARSERAAAAAAAARTARAARAAAAARAARHARAQAAASAAAAARGAERRRARAAHARSASHHGPQAGSSGPGLSCSGSADAGPLPENYAAIVSFLTAHGYSGLAAAGIAGNIYQESMGDPESVGTGGGGLIGWTPLPAGFVTGNPAADLQTQLAAILTYNQQYPQYLGELNAAGTAAQAAYVYMTYYERPGIPAAANREAAATAVAQACGL